MGAFKCNRMTAHIICRKMEGPSWTNVILMDLIKVYVVICHWTSTQGTRFYNVYSYSHRNAFFRVSFITFFCCSWWIDILLECPICIIVPVSENLIWVRKLRKCFMEKLRQNCKDSLNCCYPRSCYCLTLAKHVSEQQLRWFNRQRFC